MNTLPREEQDLQDFLAGRDDLSKQFKSLPQPSPSPELDAAIFARISGELAKESQAVKQSTPMLMQLIGFIQGHLRSFWYLPVGASALLLIGLNLREPSPTTEVAVKSVPAVPRISTKADPESVPVDKLAIARHKRPTLTEPKQVLAQAVTPQIAPAPAQIEITGSRIVQTLSASSATQSFAKTSPDANSQAEEKANAVAELASAQAQKAEDISQQRTRAVAQLLSPATGIDTYPKKEVDAQVAMAKAAEAQTPKEKFLAPDATRLTADEKTRPIKPEIPAERMAVMQPPVEIRMTRMAVAAPEIAVEMPKAKTPENVSPPWTNTPKLWLERIEAQLDRGYQQDALKEWEQFQKTYPDHPVAKQLREKIMREQAKKTP